MNNAKSFNGESIEETARTKKQRMLSKVEGDMINKQSTTTLHMGQHRLLLAAEEQIVMVRGQEAKRHRLFHLLSHLVYDAAQFD